MNRNDFFDAIGPLNSRPELDMKVIEIVEESNYIQKKISYLVDTDERISAYVLIPKNYSHPCPGVICHHQHASMYNRAKSEMVGLIGDPNLAYAKELACKGFVTLSADALPFEDRNWYRESWWGTEYFEMATRLLQGQTLLAKVLSDISASIDCLVSLPEVSDGGVGFIGHSYGARMAIWSPVFDRRIKASVSNCFCVNFKNSLIRSSGTRIPMELCVPGFLKYGDVEDVVSLIDPCSLYLSVAKEDKWCRDALEIYNYAKDSFRNSEIKLKVWPGGHAFTSAMREAAYDFLRDKLCVQ